MENVQNAYVEGSIHRANYKAFLMSMSDAAFEREKKGFEAVYWRESLDLEERFMKASIINAEVQRRATKKSTIIPMLLLSMRRSTSCILGTH